MRLTDLRCEALPVEARPDGEGLQRDPGLLAVGPLAALEPRHGARLARLDGADWVGNQKVAGLWERGKEMRGAMSRDSSETKRRLILEAS